MRGKGSTFSLPHNGVDPHRFLGDADVAGQGGKMLSDTWSEGNYAYKTICVPGFPNLFFLGGPNSPIGNFSYLLTEETQFTYIEKLITLIRDGVLSAVNPKTNFDRFGNLASWPWTFAKAQLRSAPNLSSSWVLPFS